MPRQLCEPRARLLCIVPRQRVRVQNLQGRVKLGLSNFTRTNGAAYLDYRATVDQINAARAGEVMVTGICVDRSEKIRKRHAVHGVYGGRKRR